MQHIIQWKEKREKEFDEKAKIFGPNWNYHAFNSATLRGLLTLLEEGIEPNIKLLKEDIGNLAVEGLVLGANTERDKFRTLLAEAKSSLT